FQESIRQARDRGARFQPGEHELDYAIERGFAAELVRDAARFGLRHTRLTAITSQPRLALLANNVANALDPLLGENHVHRIATQDDTRSVRSSGYTLIVSRSPSRPPLPDATPALAELGVDAQLAVRAAAQRWVDEPIAYPLPVARAPEDAQWQSARRFAREGGLLEPTWRSIGDSIQPIAAALPA
ncbi:MAG TPA: hypothetical protein VGC55_04970, partial [Dokdonella sp.]